MKATKAWPGYLDAFAEIVRRIQSSLHGSRAMLKEPVKIFVAGGAAVHAYTGARISADIDATLSRRVLLPENLEVSYRDRDGTPRVLYFDRQYNDTLGLLHENAYEDSVTLEVEGIDRNLIDLRVLSPTDLAVSKIARMAPNDREDIRSLAAAGLLDEEAVRARAEEALAGYIGDSRMVRIAIDEAGEIIRAAAPRKRK